MNISSAEIGDRSCIITKREVLRFYSKIFDPLGVVSPLLFPLKLLLRQLWEDGYNWDVGLPTKYVETFHNISSDLQTISQLKFLGSVRLGLEASQIEIHAFSDASPEGYIYLCESSQNVTNTNLIFSKTKIASQRHISIPRLELLGVLIASISITFISKSLNMENIGL